MATVSVQRDNGARTSMSLPSSSCSSTPLSFQRPRNRIQWSRPLDRSLIRIEEQALAQSDRSENRMEKVLRRWMEVHPDLPTTKVALRQRLYRLGKGDSLPSQPPAPDPPEDQNPDRVINEGDSSPSEPVELEWSEDEVLSKFAAMLSALEAGVEGDTTCREKPNCSGVPIPNRLLEIVNRAISVRWIRAVEDQTFWLLNTLVYTGAMVVKEYMDDQQKKSKPLTGKQTPTRDSLNLSIAAKVADRAKLRRQLGWLSTEIHRVAHDLPIRGMRGRQSRAHRRVRHTWGTLGLNRLRVEKEGIVAKLKVRATQIRDIRKRQKRIVANAAYHKQGPKSLRPRRQTGQQLRTPSRSELRRCWSGLLETVGEHNLEDPDVQLWYDETRAVRPEWEDPTYEDQWVQACRVMSSWKEPGPDGIRAYWWKRFPAANLLLWGFTIRVWQGECELPKWMMIGRTTLIPKEGCRGFAHQYRPIACLNTCLKLITSVIAKTMYPILDENHTIPVEQKALRKGTRGCLEAVLLDSMVTTEAKRDNANLSMAWIDYSKAYDRVPHKWLFRVLKALRIPRALRKCIKHMVRNWVSDFSVGKGSDRRSVRIAYKRGLMQGDSLSPLLFCLCLMPLSRALNRMNGFQCDHLRRPITHTLFIDDVKLYAGNRASLEHMVAVMERISNAIGMKIGVDKCAVVDVVRGRIKKNGPVRLSDNSPLPVNDPNHPYRYLGVLQTSRTNAAKTRAQLPAKYVKRLRRVWSSDLNADNKMKAHNVWAAAVFRYHLGMVKWSKSGLETLDKVTRRIMRQTKAHQYGAAVERLYLPRREGGRGLNSILHIWEQEVITAAGYLLNSESEEMQAVSMHCGDLDHLQQYNLLTQAQSVVCKYSLEVRLTNRGYESTECGDASHLTNKQVSGIVKTAQREKMSHDLAGKTIHSKYQKIVRQYAYKTKDSFWWIRMGRFQSSSESLLFAAQDGVLQTAYYRKHVLKKAISDRCRRCHTGPETVSHILGACPQLMWSAYKNRHDRVLATVLQAVAEKLGLTLPDFLQWGHIEWSGVGTLVGHNGKIYVDYPIPTDRQVSERRPDIVVFHNQSRTIKILEVACCLDSLVPTRELEKGRKYNVLACELAQQYQGWKSTIHPIVLGDLGAVGGLKGILVQTNLFSPQEAQALMYACQAATLNSAIQIFRQHFSTE